MLCTSLLLFAFFSGTRGFLKDEDYNTLPPLYTLDDLDHCRKIHGKYCKVRVKFEPLEKISPVWELMKETDKEIYYYDHSSMLKGSCFPNGPSIGVPKLEDELKNNYSSDGLLPKVEVIRCTRDNSKIGVLDLIPVIFNVFLVVMMAWATYVDYTGKSVDQKKNKILTAFSLRQNWAEVSTAKKKFPFVEGLRTYTIITVITIHSFALYGLVFLGNPKIVEKFLSNPLVSAFFGLTNFVVQTFFVLSALFLGRNILELYQANEKFTLKDVGLMILNRYLRLIPHQAFLVYMLWSNLGPIMGNGIMQDMIESEMDICKSSWPWTLLFLNNIWSSKTMCAPLTWYLAVDFQMYVIVTLACYIGLKLKMNLHKILISLSVITLVVNVVTNFIHKYPVVTPVTARSNVMAEEIRSPQFFVLYMSTYSNAVTYMMAVCFGFVSVTYNKTKILNNFFNYFLWLIVSCGLPWVALFLTQISIEEPITVAVLSATVKPLYALGYSLLVTGMIVKPDTRFHKFFTWQPLVFIGNFTYCIYMFHFTGVVGKWAGLKNLLYLTPFYMIRTMVMDLISSVLVGGFMFFLLEKPLSNITRLYVPNVQKKKS